MASTKRRSLATHTL
ncbi:hypothetical protein BsWGS_13587 [Bradybaena similaris]